MQVNGKNLKRWTSMALAWVLLFGTPSLKAVDGDVHVAMATEAGVIEETISQPSATPEIVLVEDSQVVSEVEEIAPTVAPSADVTPEMTEEAMPATTEASTPEAPEASAPEATATSVPEATETAMPEATATSVPEAMETATPEATETAMPEATETAMPEATETAMPEATETAMPEATETAMPETTETAMPEATETAMPEATETSTPEAPEASAPEATATSVPEAPLLAEMQEETIAVTVAGTDGAYSGSAAVTFDFDSQSTREQYFSYLEITATKDGQSYNWQNDLAAYYTEWDGQFGIHFTEIGTYTVSVRVKDDAEGTAPAFAFSQDSVTVAVTEGPAPVTLSVTQAEYSLDDTIRVELASTLEEQYRISDLQLVAIHEDGMRVEFTESLEVPGQATLVLPKTAPIGSWIIEATCRITTTHNMNPVDVTDKFASIAPVGFTVKSRSIFFSYSGSYITGQVYNCGQSLAAQVEYRLSTSSTQLTEEDVKLDITRNGVAYTPEAGEVQGLTFSPRFAGDYRVSVQLVDPSITGYYIDASTKTVQIRRAEVAYTAVVSPAELNPGENLHVTVSFSSALAWSEMAGNPVNSGEVYLTRNGIKVPWKTFEVNGLGEIELEGVLPQEVGAGEWQVVVNIPIINQGVDRSDNYEMDVPMTVNVHGTEVLALEAEATNGQYLASKGSVTLTADEGVDLESIVGFTVTRNGQPFEPGPDSWSSLEYNGNTATFTAQFAGEYVITPYAVHADVTYTIECVGQVSVAKAPSPVVLTLDKAVYAPEAGVVFALKALQEGIAEWDAEYAGVSMQYPRGSATYTYDYVVEQSPKTRISAPSSEGVFEVRAGISGINSEGIELSSLYEDVVASASVTLAFIEIQIDNNAEDHTYAQAAEGSAYVRFSAQPGVSGDWVDDVELWIMAGVEDAPFVLSDSGAYGQIVRDSSAGTVTYFPKYAGFYAIQLKLKEDADYVLADDGNLVTVRISKASAPIGVSVDSVRTYYPGDKVTVTLSRQGVYDEFSSVTVYALDAQKTRYEIYQGTLDDSEIQTEWNLPEDAAGGEWTICVDFAMEDGGFDFAANYATVTPVAIQVGQRYRLSAQAADGAYAGTATAAYAEFSWEGAAPDAWREDVGLQITRDGQPFAPDGTNGLIELTDAGFRFVPMVPGEFEVTPVIVGDASYRLEAQTARLSVSPAGIPAQAQVTKDATYYPGEDLDIRLNVLDGVLGEGDEISGFTVRNEAGVTLVGPVETIENQKAYLLHSFVDYHEPDGYVTYTIELEIRRNGVDVSECYAPIEAVRFIVYRGMETPVVYLTAESQNGGFGDTKDRGAYVRFHAQTPDEALEEKIELRILRDGVEFVPDGTNGVIEYGEDFIAFYPECAGVFTVEPVVKSGVNCEIVATEANVSVCKEAAAVKAEMAGTVYRPGDTLEIRLSQAYAPVDVISSEIQVYAMDANSVRHEIGIVATDALPQTLTLPLEADAPEGTWLIHVQWSMSRDGVDVSEGYATSVSIPIQVGGKTTISLEGTAVSGDIRDALAGEAYVEYTSQSDVPLEELVALKVKRDGDLYEVKNGINCEVTYSENAIRFSPWHAGEYEVRLVLKAGVEGYTLRALSSSLSVRKGDSLLSVAIDRTQYQPGDTMTWTVQVDRSMEAYVALTDAYVGLDYETGIVVLKGSLEEVFLANPSMNAYSEERIMTTSYGDGQKAIVVMYRVVTPSGEDLSDSFETVEPARFVVAAEGTTMFSLDAQVTDGNYLDIGTENAPKALFVLPEELKDSGVPMDEIRLEITTRDGEAYAPKDGEVVFGEDTVSFIPQTAGEYIVTPKLDGVDGFALLESPVQLTVSKAPAPVTYSSEESVLPFGRFDVEYAVQPDMLAEGDEFAGIQIAPSYGDYANTPYESSEPQGVASFEMSGGAGVDSERGLIAIRATILRDGVDVSDCYETGYWPFVIESGTLQLTLADAESLPGKYVAQFEAQSLVDGYDLERFVDLRVFRDGELVEDDGVQMVRSSDDPARSTIALLWPGEYVIMPVLNDNEVYRDLAFAEGTVDVTVSKAQNPVTRIEVEDSVFQVGGEVPVTVYLKDTLIDRGMEKDELANLTVWAIGEDGETTQSMSVVPTSEALESGQMTVTLPLPEDGTALGAWTVYVGTEIVFSNHGLTSDCYLEPTASASFTVEENTVTLGSEVSSGSYGSPARFVRFYDKAGKFDMQNIELEILCDGQEFVPDGTNGVVERTLDGVTFYPYCVGEFTVTPVIQAGLSGYNLDAQTCTLSVTPSEPVVYVWPEYSAYRPGKTIQAYLYVENDALDEMEAYYGDRLESIRIWMTDGELASDAVVVQAGDIDMEEPVPIEFPQGAQPGVWEIIVQPTILRDSGYDASGNYEACSESFALLEAGQTIVRIERETDEAVGYWPLTVRYDVQISGEGALSLEDLIEMDVESPEGPVEIDGDGVSVRYAQTSIEVTFNRQGEFWVCPYLKVDGDEYVLLPEDDFLRAIWVETRLYEFPVEIFCAEEEYAPGENVPLTLEAGSELQSGHRVSELSIWATNGEQSTDVVTLNDVSLPHEVELKLPEEAALGEWTIEVACRVVDANGEDVTNQYESEWSGLPLSVGRQIRLDYFGSADGNYSEASSWSVIFGTRDCQSLQELQEIVELEITRDGKPFEPDGTNGMVSYDFMDQEGVVIFEALVAGEFVVTPKLKEGMEKDCYVVAEAQAFHVTRAEAPLTLKSEAGVYQPEDELTVFLDDVQVASGYVFSDAIQSVRIWATNGDQSLEAQTFEAPLPEAVVWTLPEDVTTGEWTVQAEAQVMREGAQLDVSDCYEAVEPLRIQIVEKDDQILQLVCDSETSGFAPGVVRYRANPALAEDQLRQMVDFEITEDGQGIPIDGEKIALSYGDGEITVEIRLGGTFTLTPRLKDGVADTTLDAPAQTLTLTRQEAPVRAQIADAYRPGDAVQVSLALNEHCSQEIWTALESFEIALVAPDGTSIRQSVEGPFSAGTAIAPVSLQLPADAQQGAWTLEIRADMGLYGDCVEDFAPVQFAVTEESIQVVRLSVYSHDGDYLSYSRHTSSSKMSMISIWETSNWRSLETARSLTRARISMTPLRTSRLRRTSWVSMS